MQQSQINYDDMPFTQMVMNHPTLPQSSKDELIAVHNGTRIASLTSATMSERLFSPDLNPKRFDFIMQRVMKDPTLISECSATNTPALEFADAKKIITDIPAWLKGGCYANIEFQVVAQEFFFNRMDIYSSRMLLFQYSTNKGQLKSELDYRNVNGVTIVALMKESPELFQKFKSPRYIHRFTNAVSDSGLKIPMLRNIAFVQLDKALDKFLTKTYNKDEDIELLTLLALLADPNNESVRKATRVNEFFEGIYNDASRFSQDKGVQNMLFEEELAILDYNTSIHMAEEKGEAKGELRGEERLNNLNIWLYSTGRDDDVKKAALDPAYRKTLLAEYSKATN